MATKILITGASRGIGLEMVKQAVRRQWRTFACVRDPHSPEKLFEVARMSGGLVSVHILDVTDASQIQALAYELRQENLDILINNAGIYGPVQHTFGHVDTDGWLETFHTNAIAPLKMAEAMVPLMDKSPNKFIINMSSKMGSMADNTSGGSYIYRSSKAALNAVTKSMGVDLASGGYTCIAVHPGWVKTDMGGPNAEISTAESVKGVFNLIDTLPTNASGGFYNYDGEQIPW